ncbi:hypothetical protein B0H13DRAFT_2270870 [Mycena leptocephala]|nr:hypothetical protein B0H13DRAFT_2270870 [Mycena leptocephala]
MWHIGDQFIFCKRINEYKGLSRNFHDNNSRKLAEPQSLGYEVGLKNHEGELAKSQVQNEEHPNFPSWIHRALFCCTVDKSLYLRLTVNAEHITEHPQPKAGWGETSPHGLMAALILTVIEFTEAEYRSMYDNHLRDLIAFGEATKKYDLLEKIQIKIHNRGQFHAGVQPISQMAQVPAIGPAAFAAALKEYEEGEETDTDGEDGYISPGDKVPPSKQIEMYILMYMEGIEDYNVIWRSDGTTELCDYKSCRISCLWLQNQI